MATLTIKNLPDALYARIKARAAEHRRSINSEAIVALEFALGAGNGKDARETLAAMRRARSRVKGAPFSRGEFDAARREGRE